MTAPDDTSWMRSALCTEVNDPELFFDPEYKDAAQTVCRLCRVSWECLEYAVDNRIQYGVWGGLTEEDRAGLKSAVKAAVNPSSAAAGHPPCGRGSKHHTPT